MGCCATGCGGATGCGATGWAGAMCCTGAGAGIGAGTGATPGPGVGDIAGAGAAFMSGVHGTAVGVGLGVVGLCIIIPQNKVAFSYGC